MRKGQRKERELAERLTELGATLDKVRDSVSGTDELETLARRHEVLSAGAEALQEKSGQSWFEFHEKLAEETADLSVRVKALAERTE